VTSSSAEREQRHPGQREPRGATDDACRETTEDPPHSERSVAACGAVIERAFELGQPGTLAR
jgi:hypothetical protein